MENTMSTAKMIGALLLGTIVGGAIGVLFAPDKGAATRQKLMDNGEEFGDSMKEKFNDMMANFKKEARETIKDKTNSYIDNTISKAEKLKIS